MNLRVRRVTWDSDMMMVVVGCRGCRGVVGEERFEEREKVKSQGQIL